MSSALKLNSLIRPHYFHLVPLYYYINLILICNKTVSGVDSDEKCYPLAQTRPSLYYKERDIMPNLNRSDLNKNTLKVCPVRNYNFFFDGSIYAPFTLDGSGQHCYRSDFKLDNTGFSLVTEPGRVNQRATLVILTKCNEMSLCIQTAQLVDWPCSLLNEGSIERNSLSQLKLSGQPLGLFYTRDYVYTFVLEDPDYNDGIITVIQSCFSHLILGANYGTRLKISDCANSTTAKPMFVNLFSHSQLVVITYISPNESIHFCAHNLTVLNSWFDRSRFECGQKSQSSSLCAILLDQTVATSCKIDPTFVCPQTLDAQQQYNNEIVINSETNTFEAKLLQFEDLPYNYTVLRTIALEKDKPYIKSSLLIAFPEFVVYINELEALGDYVYPVIQRIDRSLDFIDYSDDAIYYYDVWDPEKGTRAPVGETIFNCSTLTPEQCMLDYWKCFSCGKECISKESLCLIEPRIKLTGLLTPLVTIRGTLRFKFTPSSTVNTVSVNFGQPLDEYVSCEAKYDAINSSVYCNLIAESENTVIPFNKVANIYMQANLGSGVYNYSLFNELRFVDPVFTFSPEYVFENPFTRVDIVFQHISFHHLEKFHFTMDSDTLNCSLADMNSRHYYCFLPYGPEVSSFGALSMVLDSNTWKEFAFTVKPYPNLDVSNITSSRLATFSGYNRALTFTGQYFTSMFNAEVHIEFQDQILATMSCTVESDSLMDCNDNFDISQPVPITANITWYSHSSRVIQFPNLQLHINNPPTIESGIYDEKAGIMAISLNNYETDYLAHTNAYIKCTAGCKGSTEFQCVTIEWRDGALQCLVSGSLSKTQRWRAIVTIGDYTLSRRIKSAPATGRYIMLAVYILLTVIFTIFCLAKFPKIRPRANILSLSSEKYTRTYEMELPNRPYLKKYNRPRINHY